ncbi:hypothetical protein Tco_0624691 [Tanacetum coccineum]|uniref:Uncharacterized protein n=1 Tax=Tanacetum coccineum TaxID=301880 RepID=A0ABQ4WEU7_9ASTR
MRLLRITTSFIYQQYHHILSITRTLLDNMDRREFTARPGRGQGIDYELSARFDVRRGDRGLEMLGTGIGILGRSSEVVPEIAPMDHGMRSRISQGVDMNSQAGRFNLWGIRMTHLGSVSDGSHLAHYSLTDWYLIQTQHQVHETRFQMQHAELAALRETDRRRQDQMVEAHSGYQ